MGSTNEKYWEEEIKERKKFIATLTKSINSSTSAIFIRTAILENLDAIKSLYENLEY